MTTLPVPGGHDRHVVAVYADGEAFEVKFTEPFDMPATVEAGGVCPVERVVGRARGRSSAWSVERVVG